MERRHFLISYDVSDDKRRTILFDILKGLGDHLQYSVFVCELSKKELADLRARVATTIEIRNDQVLFLDLGPAHNPLDGMLSTIGKPYTPTVKTMIV